MPFSACSPRSWYRTEIGGAALDTVGGAGECRRISRGEALIKFRDPLRGVLQKNAGDLAQEFVVVARVELPQRGDRLGSEDGGFRHGDGARAGAQVAHSNDVFCSISSMVVRPSKTFFRPS